MEEFFEVKFDVQAEKIADGVGANEQTLEAMYKDCVQPVLNEKVFNTVQCIKNIWTYDKSALPDRILGLVKLGRLIESKIQAQAMRQAMKQVIDDISEGRI